MKTWKYTSILLFYLYNSVSHWLNISCLQTVRGGRHLEISTWQDYRTWMEARASNIKAWKHESILLYFYSTYKTQSLWFNIISYLQKVRGGRHLEFNLTGLQNLQGTQSYWQKLKYKYKTSLNLLYKAHEGKVR